MAEGRRFCGRCGHDLKPGARFCAACGQPVPGGPAGQDPGAGPPPGPDLPGYQPTITTTPPLPPPAPDLPGYQPTITTNATPSPSPDRDDRWSGSAYSGTGAGAWDQPSAGTGGVSWDQPGAGPRMPPPPPPYGPPGGGPPFRGAPPARGRRRPAYLLPLVVALVVLVAGGGTAAALVLTRHSTHHHLAQGQSPGQGPTSVPSNQPTDTSGSGSAPAPAPDASPPPPTQVSVQGMSIGVAAVNTDSAMNDVATTMGAYYGGIDNRNYMQAWDTYTSSLQSTIPYGPFAKALQTSQDSNVQVQSIQHGGNGDVEADVSFTSHQSGQDGPNPGETCTNWSLDYHMVPASGATAGSISLPYQINKVTTVGAGHTSC